MVGFRGFGASYHGVDAGCRSGHRLGLSHVHRLLPIDSDLSGDA